MLQLILRGLAHHWRIHFAIALGVMAGTAVLTGALVVGDSVRGSLTHLALDRLGTIDEVLVTDRFFRTDLPTEIAARPEFQDYYTQALPAIYVQGTVENPTPQHQSRAGKVTVLGVEPEFWKLGDGGPKELPERDEVVLNQALADQIGVKTGDEVVLRIGQVSQIPADSPLGRKTETVRNRRLTVVDIIPPEGLGRFGLSPNQQLPYNAFVTPGTLQAMLEQPGKVNAILVAGKHTSESDRATASSVDASARLQELLKPSLADFGYAVQKTKRGYFQFVSNRMLIEPPMQKAADKAFADLHPQPVLTYLANWIKAGDGKGKIPYSTVTAIDSVVEPPLGPLLTRDGKPLGKLADDEIAINRWVADDFKTQGVDLKPGDEIELTYFEAESTHGEIVEGTAKFKLKAIVDLAGAAADPDFTPELKGVTDEDSIANWSPPFPYDPKRVRITPPDKNQDDVYWKEHRTTPKAFVSLDAGRKLWGSRFGRTTSLRIEPRAELAVEDLENRIQIEPSALGMTFIPVRRYSLLAATGTTPFNLLFLGFSFFIVAAAVMLVALLFRLGVEQRAAEIGILMAVGLPRRKIALLLISEALVTTLVGGALGMLLGVGYAWLMLEGLKTWWLAAITTPFLELHVHEVTLIIGLASGSVISLITIAWTVRQLGQLSARRLLAGEATPERELVPKNSVWKRRIAFALIVLALIAGAAATRLGGEAQAGAFFGSGALVLAAALTILSMRLRSASGKSRAMIGYLPIARMAARNGARNPGRSTLTIGLVAAASFLIVAISAFRLDPEAEGIGRRSGSGGFDLVAESDQPIFQNLDSAAGRDDLGFAAAASDLLGRSKTVELRVQQGDDASCLNLYQPIQPRALGIPQSLVERGGFAWVGSAAETDKERENPWLLLDKPLPPAADGTLVVPVILDMNTAMYSLHLWSGVGERFEIKDGHNLPVLAQVVGLLKNSIFQGDMLLGENDFLKLFPAVTGYRFFLIETPTGVDDKQFSGQIRSDLEETLGDYGFDAERTHDRLANFLAVQNTYLSTFQSLGGLGLLLGTFGLATVQLRSVLERRGELALMRAAGFRKSLLARLVMFENTLLLVGGLGVGVLAALIAVLPHLFGGGASVPWESLTVTLAIVIVVGLLAGLLAVRATLRAELLPALRGE